MTRVLTLGKINRENKLFYIGGFFFFLASNIKVYAYMDSNMRYIRKDMT